MGHACGKCRRRGSLGAGESIPASLVGASNAGTDASVRNAAATWSSIWPRREASWAKGKGPRKGTREKQPAHATRRLGMPQVWRPPIFKELDLQALWRLAAQLRMVTRELI